MADDALSGIITLFKALFITLIEAIKSFLPNGLLPRKSVRGQIVLVTGAGNGIGRLTAIEFSRLGATVVLWDVNEQWNEETKSKIEKVGGKAFAYKVDLCNREEIYSTSQKVIKEVGNVDILVNNAGIVSGKRFLECTDAQIERTMAVNAMAHFWTTRSFLPHMLENNRGHIVNIASIAGKIGVAGVVDYCSSKFAAVGFHEALTAELRAMNMNGVHTTVVCPYFINTGLFEGFECKSPALLPPLTPEYVTECIMEAVLTNRHMVAIPKFSYFAAAFSQILPTKAILLLNDQLGANHSMDNFKGRVTS